MKTIGPLNRIALNYIAIVLGVIALCILSAIVGTSMARAEGQDHIFMPFRAANTLLMIHNPLCGFCKAFLRDSNNGEIYNQTDVGKAFPLTILDTSNKAVREWIRDHIRDGQMKKLRGTPTFIFWQRAYTTRGHVKELGRVEGYGGMGWFNEHIEKEFCRLTTIAK